MPLLVVAACSSAAPAALPVDPSHALGTPADAFEEDENFLPDNYRYRFEWQKLRDDYEAFQKTPLNSEPCDFRSQSFRQRSTCPGPHEMAGYAIRTGGGHKSRTSGIVIDRGERDMITLDWEVALLDTDGHPVTPWTKIDHMRGNDESYADVEIAHPVLAARHRNVGMRIDHKLLQEAIRQRQGR